jgi:hypothetical protein
MKNITDRLKELGNNPMIKDSLDQIKKTVDDGVKAAKTQWDGINEDTQDKYANAINQAFDMIPMLKAIGYETENFLVHITLPPSVEIHFSSFQIIEKEHLATLKEEFKDNVMFVRTLEALNKAAHFQKKFETGNMVAKGIHVQVGIPPRVTLVYQPK